jgi:hypothetical protein
LGWAVVQLLYASSAVVVTLLVCICNEGQDGLAQVLLLLLLLAVRHVTTLLSAGHMLAVQFVVSQLLPALDCQWLLHAIKVSTS